MNPEFHRSSVSTKDFASRETMRSDETRLPRLFSYEMHQDDPSKCTSAKMRKLGLARGISKQRIPRNAVVLNPVAELPVLRSDRAYALEAGVVVIDCSWARASDVFLSRFKGLQRKLPALLAGNPTNYSKLGSLSSVEALAAALYIMNFFEQAKKLLSIYKWGETFLTLNHDALEDYSKASSVEDVRKIELDYFPYRPQTGNETAD